MNKTVTPRALLLLAAGLMLASPSLAPARDLVNSVNNASATGSPFAHRMATTRGPEGGIPGNVGQSAVPGGTPQAAPVPLTLTRRGDALAEPVGNNASARGGFGTGERQG